MRIGLLGTVIGLIVAFSAAGTGGSDDPGEIRRMIASVIDGMYVSLYATLLGIATNLWPRSTSAFSESAMDEETLTVWLDTALLMLGGFVLMTILMMEAMNPPTTSSAAQGIASPGNLIIEIKWPNGTAGADIDLWIQAPGDRPVGYSNKNGRILNLLRDDVGDDCGLPNNLACNYELALSSGLPPGEYAVNAHLYRASNGVSLPILVQVSIGMRSEGATRQILAKTIELARPNHEVTVFRFRLDRAGQLVAGSVNSLFKGLRVAS